MCYVISIWHDSTHVSCKWHDTTQKDTNKFSKKNYFASKIVQKIFQNNFKKFQKIFFFFFLKNKKYISILFHFVSFCVVLCCAIWCCVCCVVWCCVVSCQLDSLITIPFRVQSSIWKNKNLIFFLFRLDIIPLPKQNKKFSNQQLIQRYSPLVTKDSPRVVLWSSW